MIIESIVTKKKNTSVYSLLKIFIYRLKALNEYATGLINGHMIWIFHIVKFGLFDIHLLSSDRHKVLLIFYSFKCTSTYKCVVIKLHLNLYLSTKLTTVLMKY